MSNSHNPQPDKPDSLDSIVDKLFSEIVRSCPPTSEVPTDTKRALHARKDAYRALQHLIEKQCLRNIEEIRQWVKYNKHDMGELGEFIRTKYVYNKLDELKGKIDGTS